ncbi:MAG: sensor histidine kinase KdpD [Myxococcales bacterium]
MGEQRRDALGRPDPDELLRRLNAERERAERGKFKVFFGFAPGVGKTYAMLESAHRLKGQGIDVVVGAVETHGRTETEKLCVGLEVLPRREVLHRGTTLHEFDLERALVRKPQVLLLDELAHTNAEGSRHRKRYQDALDLLEAGIEVHTTLNVQHVESLNDVVAQVTSVRVRETVPDAVLDRAEEIELVDLPPEDLLARLREGRVYIPEQASRAAQNFFKLGNLLALRELALRRTADRVDVDVRAYRAEHRIDQVWAAGERILVCVGPSPGSARLVRAARRMSAGLRAPWLAVYVERSTGAPIGQSARERLESNLRLAESLGGTVVRLVGTDVADSLLEYARKHNVTRIILGKPTHPRLRDRLRGSLVDSVVRGSGGIDVHVISGDAGDAPSRPAPPPPSQRTGLRSYLWALVAVGAATGLAALLRVVLAPPDLVMIYLVAIMLVAIRFPLSVAILASALSVAVYDFFFVPPYRTLAVSDVRHLLTFLMMFAVGVVISNLTLRLRRQELRAREREDRTATLYALSRDLGTTFGEPQVAAVLARHASSVFGVAANVSKLSERRSLTRLASAGAAPIGPTEDGAARWVLEHGRPAGCGTDTLPGARTFSVPLSVGPNVHAALSIAPRSPHGLSFDERDFLTAFARQGAQALERAMLAEEAKRAALHARAEEMRSSLLSAVSHDLRTPLAAITGAASSLRDQSVHIPEAQRVELLDTIGEEAERLERLVSNLLDMTRLEAGGVALRREWVPLEELVGSSLTRLEGKLRGHPIDVSLPAELPLVAVDPVLFEQVFVNLFENIAKYTPVGTRVAVRGWVEPPGERTGVPDAAERAAPVVAIELRDWGPGLPEGGEERVFEKFYRGSHRGVAGVGLGLPICRGIVEAHGGTISAENPLDGGAGFVIRLPLDQSPPDVELAPDSIVESSSNGASS